MRLSALQTTMVETISYFIIHKIRVLLFQIYSKFHVRLVTSLTVNILANLLSKLNVFRARDTTEW